MVKSIPVWQLQSGDAVYIKGARMIITGIDDEITGITMRSIDGEGRGHYLVYGHDDIVSLDLQ